MPTTFTDRSARRISDAVRVVEGMRLDKLGVRRDPRLGAGSGGATRMVVKTVGENTLTCRTWDGTDEGAEDIEVAKPWLLRRDVIDTAVIDGATIAWVDNDTVTATSGATVETWHITVVYYTDCQITASRGLVGGTGITDVDWYDVNTDGRTWAVEATA